MTGLTVREPSPRPRRVRSGATKPSPFALLGLTAILIALASTLLSSGVPGLATPLAAAAPQEEPRSPIFRTESSDPASDDREDAVEAARSSRFGPFERIFVIPIEGTIDGGLATSIERRIESAKEAGADCIVFDIDTYGGEVFAAEKITGLIFPLSPIRPGDDGIHTVGYVSDKAISAGALIAFSCREIYMRYGTRMGDCEPITMSASEGVQTLPEKFQSPLRAKFRTFAQRNGYPVAIAEAMVTKELGVVKIRFKGQDGYSFYTIAETETWSEEKRDQIEEETVLLLKGQLPTFNDGESEELGLSSGTVRDREELLDILSGGEYVSPVAGENVLEISWSEEMVRFLQTWKFVFFVIGVIGLYLEFKTPGFGAPGIVGIIAFGLLFGSSYLSGLAEAWEVLVFFAGVGLLVFEIFILPGFGIPGVAGLLLILVSFYLASQPFVIPGFEDDTLSAPYEMDMLSRWVFQFTLSLVISIVLMVLLARWLPKSRLFGRLILEPAPAGGGPVFAQAAEGQVGETGKTLSALRPAGRAMIGDRKVEVVTQGDFIDEGTDVEVIDVRGNRIVVRRRTS